MSDWTDPNRKVSLDSRLSTFSDDKNWPGGKGKAGLPATDYAKKVKLCVGLMTHAPVTTRVDGRWSIMPLSPLPEGHQWKDLIGFDLHEHFSGTSIEDSHKMRI